jgi:plasmid rolling circle replication initiator protein Rep
VLYNNTNIDKFSKPKDTILDTLVSSPPNSFVKGQIKDQKTLNKLETKQLYKQKTRALNSQLIKLEHSPLINGYKRAFNDCCKFLREQNGIVSANKYCNSRSCFICNRIRSAKMINGYLEPLKQLAEQEPDKQLDFITLTLPNCKNEELREVITKMFKDFQNIIRTLNEKKGYNVSGLRVLETTYNKKDNDYHPHFHIIANKNIGELIVAEWLKRNKEAKLYGYDYKLKKMVRLQVVKKITPTTDSLLEVFKYCTKFFDDDKLADIVAIDNILVAMSGKVITRKFGKELKKVEISEEVEQEDMTSEDFTEELKDRNLISNDYPRFYQWNEIVRNWIDKDCIPITDFYPNQFDELKYIINYKT